MSTHMHGVTRASQAHPEGPAGFPINKVCMANARKVYGSACANTLLVAVCLGCPVHQAAMLGQLHSTRCMPAKLLCTRHRACDTRCLLPSAPKKPFNTSKTNYFRVIIRRAFRHPHQGGVLNPGAAQTAARIQGPAKP